MFSAKWKPFLFQGGWGGGGGVIKKKQEVFHYAGLASNRPVFTGGNNNLHAVVQFALDIK